MVCPSGSTAWETMSAQSTRASGSARHDMASSWLPPLAMSGGGMSRTWKERSRELRTKSLSSLMGK
jgi:hypothetical protein